jgi:PAS domain S-box-containing protein
MPDRQEPYQRPPDELVTSLMERMVDYIWTTDLGLKFTYVSPAVHRVFGYRSEDLIGLSIEDIVPAGSLDEAMALLREQMRADGTGALDPDPTRTVVLKGKRNDGQEVWVEMNIRFIRDERGEPVGLLGITRDITLKKRYEEELKVKGHALTERVKELNCLYYISRLMRENEKPLGEVVQKAIEIIPLSWQFVDICCARVSLDGLVLQTPNWKDTQWKIKTELAAADRVYGQIEVCYLLERAHLPEEVTLLGTIARMLSEIIERRRAEDALKDIRDRHRTVFDNTLDPIAVIDLKGRVQSCNDSFVSLTGHRREDIVGRSFRHIPKATGDHLEEYGDIFLRLMEGERAEPFEIKWESPGRDPRRLLVIPCLLRKGREVTGLQVMLRGPAPRDIKAQDIATNKGKRQR